MQYLTFYDAAYPPPPGAEPATDGVLFYAGGDTPHVWSVGEVERQPARYRIPAFVRSDPQFADPDRDVLAMRSQLARLACPAGRLVAWDVETAVDRAYIRRVCQLMGPAHPVILYGSRLTVFGNQIPDGLYDAADWTNIPHLVPGSQMTQYQNFLAYDLEVGLPNLPYWDTRPRRPVPPNWQDTAMHLLPVIGEGNNGAPVRTAQALALARGHNLTVDGRFGPQTKAAIVAVQQQARITADGIIGPATWPVLMGVA